MKKQIYFFLSGSTVLLLSLIAGVLSSCQDTCEQTYVYTTYEPVYMSYEEFRATARIEEPTALVQPGKIYIREPYLFVNEYNKGIHIFDNSNPSAPRAISFLNIPGNVDLAVKGNILYADSQIDLVAFDISDPANVRLTKRIENIFPTPHYPGIMRWSVANPEMDASKGVIVDWIKKEEKKVSGCDQATDLPTGWVGGRWIEMDMAAFTSASPTRGTTAQPSAAGVGGSMARFAIYQNYLYTIDQANMQVFDITQAASPVATKKINVGWNIETIFPYKDKLFIGSQTGMHIFDNANPEQPVFVSTFNHARACDPVVADDKYAYVTLRTGTPCTGIQNQLDVVDISNLKAPKLVKSYPMSNPHGLGIDENTLFVCDGTAGLKVYDATDVTTIDQHLQNTQSIHSFDVIPYHNIALVIGNDGLYQYDYSIPSQLKLLSKISIQAAKN